MLASDISQVFVWKVVNTVYFKEQALVSDSVAHVTKGFGRS